MTGVQKAQQRAILQEALSAAADFLSQYLPLANSHAVDFIVQDAWNQVLPEYIRNELLTLSDEQLMQLPSGRIGPDCLNACQTHIDEETEGCECSIAENHSENYQLRADKLETDLNNEQCHDNTHKAAQLESNHEIFQKEAESNHESKNIVWKAASVRHFLSGVRKNCVDQLLCLSDFVNGLSSWLNDKDTQGVERKPFVHAFMNEKKMHEVEIMADLCAQIFERSSADVVIDLGSGKGYLSTHLSLQCHLPVIGIDSQPRNTSGAAQRAVKLEQQWDSLVRHEQKKLEKESVQVKEIEQKMTEKCSLCVDESSNTAEGQSILSHNKHAVSDVWQVGDKEHGVREKPASEMHCSNSTQTESNPKSNLKSNLCSQSQKPSEKSTPLSNGYKPDVVEQPGKKEKQRETENQTEQSNVTSKEQTDKENQTEQSNVISKKQMHKENQTQPSKLTSKNIAVTMFVSPDTRLIELVNDSVHTLCPEKTVEDVRVLLTGLHTCGPLAASMLRLFVKDETVRAMCGVGCCYQLMQERFVSDDSGDWRDTHRHHDDAGKLDSRERPNQTEGDFPLSSVLLERKMCIGRTALNIASLSLQRMTQSSGELQGKTYYPRALLQAFIHSKLGYVPQDLKKLRKLAKQASDPLDYVRRAICKLNIPGCEATEEEIRQFHTCHSHMEKKMAAFFQLRAALAPVVETVVMLDRVVYLLEQDCVENACLVRLFDPVTSPRCHAIIAFKKE